MGAEWLRTDAIGYANVKRRTKILMYVSIKADNTSSAIYDDKEPRRRIALPGISRNTKLNGSGKQHFTRENILHLDYLFERLDQ